MLLPIGTFRIDLDSQRSTLWHQLIPATRVFCTLLMVFAIALTPNGRWWTWAIYGICVFSWVIISRVTLPVLLGRVAVEFVFIGVVLLGTLFRDGGEVYWSLGFLRITSEGLTTLASVALKAFLSLVTVNILVLTTAIPDLLGALVILKVPPLLVAIMASMVRYLGLLVDEFTSMRRAALSRNLMGSPSWQRLVVGNMIGSLFIRTYDRGERIYQSMLSRGYTGFLPVIEPPQIGAKDRVIVIMTVILLIFGQIVYWFL
jgi:cobalt/nickel transport system permease protein